MIMIISFNKRIIHFLSVSPCSYLSYIKLCTLVKRNESMARTLQAKLKEPDADENKRGPRPQDLIRLYDIILQVHYHPNSSTCFSWYTTLSFLADSRYLCDNLFVLSTGYDVCPTTSLPSQC